MQQQRRPARQKNKPKSLWLVFFILMSLFWGGSYLSLRFGAVQFSHTELLTVLRQPWQDSPHQDIIMDLRLPRLVAAGLVGAALAQSGAIMQGVTRNPIADPGLLGINAGSGLALILGFALIQDLHYSQILVICLLGSLLACLIVFALAYQAGKGYHQLRLILAGAMVSTLFSAIGQGITLYFDLSTTIIGWQAGGLAQTNWQMLAIIAPFILLGLILAQLLSHQLTILSLNETVSKALGQQTVPITLLLLGVVLLLSASSVALIGTVGFVGLIIPHLIRHFIPKDYRLLLPLAAFCGGTFMIWVDLISRVAHPPAETPMTAIISAIGLPCFLWLIQRGKQL